MPDTGAPWNIPYVAGTDLVSDWPTDSQTLAEAIADALDDAGATKQVKSTVKTDTFTTTNTSLTDITSLSVSITPTSASNNVLVIASVPAVMEDAGSGQVSGMLTIARDGTNLVNAASPGSRSPVFAATSAAGLTRVGSLMDVHTFVLLDSPASTSALTYNVRGMVKLSSGTLYVNRASNTTDTSDRPRGVATITVMEVQP